MIRNCAFRGQASTAAIFAGPLAVAIQNNNIIIISINTTINPETVAPGYPKFMCLSTFGALISEALSLKESDQKMMAHAFGEHQMLFDRVINSKTCRFTSTGLHLLDC